MQLVQALSGSCLSDGRGTTLSEQDESVFQTFKDTTGKQNCGRDHNNQIHGAGYSGQVQGNSDAPKFLFSQGLLGSEVNKRFFQWQQGP